MDQYQNYIALSRYARWLPDKNRRETWEETVARFCDFFESRFPNTFPRELVEKGILSHEVMPSMRALMTAGRALERDEIAGYNCSYIAIDDLRCFDEILYILMCGVGVGFSVEAEDVAKLPTVPTVWRPCSAEDVIKIDDSRIGWAASLRVLIEQLYAGRIQKFDYSAIRKAGERLITFGGRASGPEPLMELHKFVTELFLRAGGRRLTPLECHDLVCKIADVVVVGGVRRSALISLSDLADQSMRRAKIGEWWVDEPQRALANNSAVYTERPDVLTFTQEWSALIESRSGERGLFNRLAAKHKAAANGRRELSHKFGTNPCGEIILRPNQLCNLSEVVVRSGDTIEDLRRKVEIAAIIGTFQSTLTNFRYVRPVWVHNCNEERLLGVSLTGMCDNPELSFKASVLSSLRDVAVQTNQMWADKLGIAYSTAVTTVKPSGTVSQLVNSASGIHERFSKWYIRRVRGDVKDPLSQLLVDAGVPYEVDVTNPNNYVFSFPQEAPDGSDTAQPTAIEQLERYLVVREAWCEHNPSITVYVADDEWLEVGAFVYKHFNELGGVSFLPKSDHVYRQAPYEAIDEDTYKALKSKMPVVDWSRLSEYELEDSTVHQQTLACVGGVCEL